MPLSPPPAPGAAAPPQDTPVPERDLAYTTRNNLRLSARDYGDPQSPWLPVVCLAGLSRSSRDFAALATHLAGDPIHPRRVIAFDYRGRGRSAWDAEPRNYTAAVEMADVIDGMVIAGVSRAVIVGTSRGGIIGMMMALAQPNLVAGLVLNDIGPAIESLGLARIKAYIGRTPEPDTWAEAAQIQRRLHGNQFTGWTDDDWDLFARLTYRDQDGRPVPDYDPALATTFDGVELDRPAPAIWDEFATLKALPIMAIRGANSDLLSAETLTRMAALHPGLEAVTVEGEGHPPLLRGALLSRISTFIAGIDAATT